MLIKISKIGGIGISKDSSVNKNPELPPSTPYLKTNIKNMWINSNITFLKIYSNVNWIIK